MKMLKHLQGDQDARQDYQISRAISRVFPQQIPAG
jgi:hypothetical protein